ncbi:MAG: tyrosine-type recombinase/integrase [Eubacteriales bacterium]|nr:tyrosine-type recombinase/integrase [Eubacteriales bacterium]
MEKYNNQSFCSSVQTQRETREPPKTDAVFGEMIDRFLIQQKYQVKQSTYAHYVNLIDTHIRPQLGACAVSELSSGVIEEYASEKLRNGKLDGKGGLSPKTVRDLLTLIRMTIKYGVAKGEIGPEVLFFSSPRVPKKDVRVIPQQELQKLEKFCLDTRNHLYFGIYLCLYTGLRIGELCALQWQDIDLKCGCLCINKTILRINSTEKEDRQTVVLIDTPKTVHSKRIIPLPSHLIKLLAKRKTKDYGPDTYFLTGTTSYIEPRNYYNKYKHCLRECGLPAYTFHTLRHTFATRCVEKGMDPKALSEILGHADVKTTLDKYVHPSLEYKRNCMELLSSD